MEDKHYHVRSALRQNTIKVVVHMRDEAIDALSHISKKIPCIRSDLLRDFLPKNWDLESHVDVDHLMCRARNIKKSESEYYAGELLKLCNLAIAENAASAHMQELMMNAYWRIDSVYKTIL